MIRETDSDGEADVMPPDAIQDDPYDRWRSSLAHLLGSREALIGWQDRRYRFAHRVGRLLTDSLESQPEVQGAVLYGVYVAGVGLAYVGQTGDARRRLRDLPIGESHHLGMTIPPELWERVVVVQWRALLEEAPPSVRQAISGLELQVIGLALEHRLQLDERPPLNARSRAQDGTWKDRRPDQSRSRGALHANAVAELYLRVRETWNDLADATEVTSDPFVHTVSAGRAAFPAALSDHFGA